MRVFVVAGAGFLLAVLWFDLMFDVQVLPYRGEGLPEPVLASIAAYYRRVTTGARPMNRLVAAAMLATIATLVAEVAGNAGRHWPGWVSLVLVGSAVTLAGGRTVPNAVRLGAGNDPPPRQAALARSICRDHLVCFAAISAALLLQLAWAR